MIFVGIPTHSGLMSTQLVGPMLQTYEDGRVGRTPRVFLYTQMSSLLTRGFNQLWCMALNLRAEGCTHFLLWHADIEPERHFLVKMLNIMKEHQADILSAVVAIKNPETYDTSTAFKIDGTYVRQKFKELPQKTFTAENIAVNSGLMLVDLSKEWVEKVWFRFEDWIEKDKLWQARGVSEDWLFSEDAIKLGAKVFATREIKTLHHGSIGYANWGHSE